MLASTDPDANRDSERSDQMVQAVVETEGPRSKRAVILAAAIDSFGHDGYEHT